MSAPTNTERRARFRALVAERRVVRPASVHDAISARAAEDVGFDMAMLAGSVASLAVLGAPDLVVLTLTEFAEQCRRIGRAGNLPLLVDADHGFGNALSVRRTVEELEAAGVAALTIEDTLLPRPFGDGGKASLISQEEGVGKIRAALAGRRDRELTILARTNLSLAPLKEIVARVKAYEAAGADGVFLSGPKAKEQIRAVSRATDLPLVLGPITGELDEEAFLVEHGVRIVLQGHKPFMAAVKAAYDAYVALYAGTAPSELKNIASADLMRQLTREDDYDALSERTLGGTG